MRPLPHMAVQMTMTMAVMASSQLAVQLWMAEPERVRPMAMTMGPVTTGGKKRMIRSVPKLLSKAAMTKYSKAAAPTPTQA